MVQVNRIRLVLYPIGTSNSIATACSQAANALRSVRSQLQGGRTEQSSDETAREEHRANFAPYTFSAKSKKRRGGALPSLVPKRGKKRVSWTQKFICLASKDRRRVPGSIGEKEELIEAGLGEKSVFIPDVECSAQEFKETLITEFPKLADAGGFELMRCIPNSRQLEPISTTVSQQPKSLKAIVGNGRIYIRPIQRDLDLTPCEDADEV